MLIEYLTEHYHIHRQIMHDPSHILLHRRLDQLLFQIP